MYDASSVARSRGKKVIDTGGRARCTFRERSARVCRIHERFEETRIDAGRRDEAMRRRPGSTRRIFVAGANPGSLLLVFIFILLVSSTSSSSPSSFSSYSAFFLLRKTTKATRRSRGRRRKTHSRRCGREKRFQSKKGRSAPHIPPVVSAGLGATEPLRGSTIRGLSGAQRASANASGAEPPRRERREE